MSETAVGTQTEEFWESFYAERDQVWTGKPNQLVAREVTDLPPGTALDVGCAEGGDAVWLAGRGWRVTGTDVSATALRRAAAHAEEAGVATRIDWQRHDLSRTFPAGSFDLVTSAYLHTPIEQEGERVAVLRRAAAAVAPGGVLLVVGHAEVPSWHEGHSSVRLHSTAEVVAELDLQAPRWWVDVEDRVVREATGPDGRPGTAADNVLLARRIG